jgi:TDG/mug DNA glycosylase family protein
MELHDAVPDTLGPGMCLVFVGINPGHWSARAKAPFANPRNDFWRLLQAAGLTPRLFEPHEYEELLDLGIGLTNAARRTTRGSGDLRKADFAGAAERLEDIAATYRPGVLAFVGKAAYTGAFGGRVDLGLQARSLDGTQLFVLPSTSPANAAVPWDERLRWFRALRELVDG